MAFCKNCGYQINDNAKFCIRCGELNDKTQTDNKTKRQQEYAGKIIKCPVCGENIPSFTAICPTCGYEFRGTDSSDSVKELASKLENAITDKERASLIRTFPVPNTREDILEFMILASTNIKNSFQAEICEAWSVKFEQAFEKSKILYGELLEFNRCYDLFVKNSMMIRKKTKAIERKEASDKRKERSSEFFKKNKKWIVNVSVMVGCFAMFFLILLFMAMPHTIKVNQLEKLIDQVEECIAEGDFDTAKIKANQIIDDSGWSSESEKKYDDIRNSLLEAIEQKEIALGSKVYIGASNKDFIGQNYLEVIEQLKGKGFNNIKSVPVEDLITGWLTKEGEVEGVTINGNGKFSEKSAYSTDAEIVVSYHTFKSK